MNWINSNIREDKEFNGHGNSGDRVKLWKHRVLWNFEIPRVLLVGQIPVNLCTLEVLANTCLYLLADKVLPPSFT